MIGNSMTNTLMLRTLMQMIKPKLQAMKVNESTVKQFSVPGYSICGSITALEMDGLVKVIVSIKPCVPLDPTRGNDIAHEATITRIV